MKHSVVLLRLLGYEQKRKELDENEINNNTVYIKCWEIIKQIRGNIRISISYNDNVAKNITPQYNIHIT